MRAERLEAPLSGEFGPPPEPFRSGFRTAFDRATHLGRSLDAVRGHFGADGKPLILWLSQALRRLSTEQTVDAGTRRQ